MASRTGIGSRVNADVPPTTLPDEFLEGRLLLFVEYVSSCIQKDNHSEAGKPRPSKIGWVLRHLHREAASRSHLLDGRATGVYGIFVTKTRRLREYENPRLGRLGWRWLTATG